VCKSEQQQPPLQLLAAILRAGEYDVRSTTRKGKGEGLVCYVGFPPAARKEESRQTARVKARDQRKRSGTGIVGKRERRSERIERGE